MSSRILLTATLASSLFLPAFAAVAAPSNDQGIYAGVGTGFGSLENDRDEVDNFIESGAEGFDIDDDDNVFKGFVGYDLNAFLATELFYSDLGQVQLKGNDVANTDLESKAYGINLIGKLPITPWFTAFAKAGIAKWETDIDGNLGNASLDLKDNDGTDPVYGVGAQFNFNPLLVRAEYERYDFDSDYQIDTFTASVGVRF